MAFDLSEPASRLRTLVTRSLARLGFKEDSYLLILAVIVGAVTAVAAAGFHELILLVRDTLYLGAGEERLYHRGIWLLIVYPMLGGLLVGVISRYVFHTREGHGIVDVMESVARSSGFERPTTAFEKIVTAGITIGSGGSAGAEGPIVQIGAGIASGIGQLFRVARNHMPVLIGCGSAAGISAIFNAPFGGVLFTLEVILQDFSIRAFTPVVLASVIAQVTELLLFKVFHHAAEFHPIFNVSPDEIRTHEALQWGQVGNFVLLGIICGLVALSLIRLMNLGEHLFARLKVPKFLSPAIGGAILGVMGVGYVLVLGRWLLHVPKPVPFSTYPMPAFYGDGYGFIEALLHPDYHAYAADPGRILILLASLCVLKAIATVVTLSSGGSGGVIAPSLFLGATIGAVLGALLQKSGLFAEIHPEVYALVGMGAVLAAVVHAPLASILIVFEVTEDYKVMVPAMLACIIATGLARVMYRDSIYTLSLRSRGVRMGGTADLTLLRRLNVEQVPLEPASIVRANDPLQKVLDLTVATGVTCFVVADEEGNYSGMVVGDDLQTAMLEHEAIPLLVVAEMMRRDLPLIKNSDDLATVMDAFSNYDVNFLPVTMRSRPKQVIGLISRSALMRRYQRGLSEPT
ncbi:MAG: chloride channel protein [Planctomycetota bacterium]|nr:chloride channel protein [Planctomycetota bacterium]